MLWITDNTPEHAAARLEAIRRHVPRATRGMTVVAAGAATVQALLYMTYMFCL